MFKNLRKTPQILTFAAKVKFPEKFKGTLIEKWANYWKNLFIDYRQMLQDLRTDIQDDPKKAMKYTIGILTMFTLLKKNPNEIDFRDELKCIGNEMATVSSECLNDKAVDHLRFLVLMKLKTHTRNKKQVLSSIFIIFVLAVLIFPLKCER